MGLVQIGVKTSPAEEDDFKVFPGGKHMNSKTFMSYDISTLCPLTAANKSCVYCYVESQRVHNGFYKKAKSRHDAYDGWVLRLRQESIDKMNRVGGLRMFSWGDYQPKYRHEVAHLLDDCATRSLYAKAITKVLSFVNHFHDHPIISTVHLSIDNLKGDIGRSPITHPRAKQMRELWDKVKVRATVLCDDDMEYFGSQDWVDILTFNHAINGFKMFKKAEILKASRRFPRRVCAVNETCEGCKAKCGLYNEAFTKV